MPAKVSAQVRDDLRLFQIFYRDWLAARARRCDPDAPGGDEEQAARHRDCDAGELALLAMPAPSPWCVFLKWEVLEHLVADAEDGNLIDNRVTMALGCVKADILGFGLKDPEE
jgi:hypothetical protein